MRIEIIQTERGPRFYWHTLGGDNVAWVLFHPKTTDIVLTLVRAGTVMYSEALLSDSFGPLQGCFKIANARILGVHHPKLYASLFHIDDSLTITLSRALTVPAPDFDSQIWQRFKGYGDLDAPLHRQSI